MGCTGFSAAFVGRAGPRTGRRRHDQRDVTPGSNGRGAARGLRRFDLASGAGRTFEPQMGIATDRERDRVDREGMGARGAERERGRGHQHARGAGAAPAVRARGRAAAGLVGLAAVVRVGDGVPLALAARIDDARHARLLEPEGEDQQ